MNDYLEEVKAWLAEEKKGKRPSKDTAYIGHMERLVEEVERLRGLPSLIPATWLDPILSGDSAVNLGDCNVTQIEALLQRIKAEMEKAIANG